MKIVASRLRSCLAIILLALIFGCTSFSKKVELPKEDPLSVELKGLTAFVKEQKIDPRKDHTVTLHIACVDEKMCNRAAESAKAAGFEADWHSSPDIDYIFVNLSLRIKPQEEQLRDSILKARKIARSVGAVQYGYYVESLPGEGPNL